MTAAVILAAGASIRLGEPKQLVRLGGETLLERAVRVAQEAGLAPVIVVVHDAELIDSLRARGAEVLLNRRYYKGMSTSIHTGIRWAQGRAATGVVLMTCDQPAVTADHLRALCATPDSVTGSGYSGRIGVPAYFPANHWNDLLQLQGDKGARDLLRDARVVACESLQLDLDTPEDLKRARELFD